MNDVHDIALAKRFDECILRVPEFDNLFKKNPTLYLKAIGIKEDPKWYEYTIINNRIIAKHAGTPLDQFQKQYIDGIYQIISQNIYSRMIPDNIQFRNWREKQNKRCTMNHMPGILHVPLVFELTSGCSVGCEFCGLASKELKGIYRATPEHIENFKTMLDIAVNIIGNAAACGILYYASEPLDNPDYEVFEKIMHEKSGAYPQITTAIPLRDVARTKRLLATINQEPNNFHRFSVRDISDVFKIYKEFAPEEMLYTMIETRFQEFPGTLIKSGKMASKSGFFEGSIACVSGFVVNLIEKTISLRSPVSASKAYPTGEIIYKTKTYRSLFDFDFIMREMINDYM